MYLNTQNRTIKFIEVNKNLGSKGHKLLSCLHSISNEKQNFSYQLRK